MPAIQYWFIGSAIAAFIAFVATGFAWYRAAADAASQKQKSLTTKDLLQSAFAGGALATFFAFATTGYAWYRAAGSEQDSAAQIVAAATQKQKSIRAKDLLGKVLVDGRAIQVEAGKGALPDDQLEQQTREWATHTQAVISAAYGDGEAALFLSDAGFMAMGSGGPHTSEKGKLILIFLYRRLDRISALIGRSDTLTLRLGFDPAKFD